MRLPPKYIATLNHEDQNNTLIKSGINQFVSLLEGDGIPMALLYHVDATFASCACCCVKTLWLVNVTPITLATNTSLVVPRTLKQATQYNNYCIWILKPKIQIKFSRALLEICWPWIIFESWYCVRMPIFLHHIVLFDADF
jgi:hypothetical protein